MGILGIFKLIGGFASAYKYILIAVAVGGFLITGYNYISNHAEMKAQIIAYDAEITSCLATGVDLHVEIDEQNVRISTSNALQRERIAEGELRLQAANATVEVLRGEKKELKIELGVTRFETLEAIRDDEDFEDWVSWGVPGIAWSLLRDSAEGRYPSSD